MLGVLLCFVQSVTIDWKVREIEPRTVRKVDLKRGMSLLAHGSEIHIKRTVYSDCKDDVDGGAICVVDDSVSLFMQSLIFDNCRVTGIGGAVFFQGVNSNVDGVCCNNCAADDMIQTLALVAVTSSSEHNFHLNLTSIVKCPGNGNYAKNGYGSLYLQDGNQSLVTTNMTRNTISGPLVYMNANYAYIKFCNIVDAECDDAFFMLVNYRQFTIKRACDITVLNMKDVQAHQVVFRTYYHEWVTNVEVSLGSFHQVTGQWCYTYKSNLRFSLCAFDRTRNDILKTSDTMRISEDNCVFGQKPTTNEIKLYQTAMCEAELPIYIEDKPSGGIIPRVVNFFTKIWKRIETV